MIVTVRDSGRVMSRRASSASPDASKVAPTFEPAPKPPAPDGLADPVPPPRSVADWKVSDLVSDKDADGSPGPVSKP